MPITVTAKAHVVLTALRIDPGDNADKVRDKARDGAFDDGIIANNDICIIWSSLVLLMNS